MVLTASVREEKLKEKERNRRIWKQNTKANFSALNLYQFVFVLTRERKYTTYKYD
jgi:hypothetical protein